MSQTESGGQTPRRPKVPGGPLLLVVGLLLTATGLVVLAGPSNVGRTLGVDGLDQSRTITSDEAPRAAPTVPAPSMELENETQAPKPIGIRIPTIDVDADMIALGIREDGSIEVPTDFSQTGWWADGPEPGETGPAVVLGHVDSRAGPAVFFSLTDLRSGDEVIVERIDGSTVVYRVDRIEQHPKDDFPTEAVYGDTDDAQLRLVTCGGEFDSSERSYRDNIVVFASMA